MTHLTLALLATAVVLGCRKDAATSPPSMAPTPAASTPAGSGSAQTIDELWALAPAGTQMAVVASPRAVQLLERAAVTAAANAGQLPEMQAQLEAFGKDFATRVRTFRSLAELGLRADRGFATFGTGAGQLWILPVADRAKFVTAMRGTRGASHDTIGGMTCNMVKDLYVCASAPSLVGTLGQGNVRARIDIVQARGDIEGFVDPNPVLSTAFVAQLEPGRVRIEAALPKFGTSGISLGDATKPRVAPDTSGFVVFDLARYLTNLPPTPLTADLTLHELGASIRGPITASLRAGSADLGIRVPLRDVGPANKLIAGCAVIFPWAVASKAPNVCRVAPPVFAGEIDLWVEGTELRIGDRTGGRAGIAATPPVETSQKPNLFANHAWALAAWGRGTLFGSPSLSVPGQIGDQLKRFLGLSELGVGVRVDGDVTRVSFIGRTIWDNPDEVIAKLAALQAHEVMNPAKLKAIADATPGSPFAADLAAGQNGIMIATFAVGVLAGVGMPALMQHMKEVERAGMRPTFAIEFDRIVGKVTTAFAGSKRFPVGKTPLTPANVCCTYPDHKCPAGPDTWKATVWKDLGFQIDEPGLFQYSYESDGKLFTVRAVTDLDCDGTTITHTLKGWISNGQVSTTVIHAPPNSD
ncbi:MAG: hypothetical protein AB7O24_19395 [Kofleriaceae bacterium]